MSDSNNNGYVFGYDVVEDTDDVIVRMKNEKNKLDYLDKDGLQHFTKDVRVNDISSVDGSVESLARYGMNIYESTDDESAFMSDDSSNATVERAKRDFQNHRYTRTKSRSSSSSHGGRVYSKIQTRGHSKLKRQSPRKRKANSRSSSQSDSVEITDVILEDEEMTSYQRSHSNPSILCNKSLVEIRNSRLQRRRSAVTFPSTYRTLSAPPRLTPPRPTLGSLVASATPSIASVGSTHEACCYGNLPIPRGFNRTSRHETSWSNLMTCLAHKKENGVRMTPTQLLIRKSLEKAIQKAGYNMNELALSMSSPSSPMSSRKSEPKCKVDWTEASVIGEHIWAPSNQAGDLCYVGEQMCKKSGPRKKCSACHIVVHDSCLEQLDKIGFQCKVTFREASTRNLRENLVVRHHWVHRRRQEGKCRHCGKAFEKRFGFRDSKILAISCSWCKEAYHNKVSCFRMQKINEACTLGVHARIIVPPTWIVKWTPKGRSVRNRSKKKRSSGMWRKKSSKEGKQRLFVIRPLPEHTPYLSPTIVFINPKSGGNQGVKLLQTFQWLLNQRQVFNLSEGGPKEALEMFRKVPNLRILACGGDGTVGWILSILDEMNIGKWPPVAILPLGTGNDLSRTLNWGSGYTDEPICKVLQHVEEGKVVQVDRWKLDVQPNLEGKFDDDGETGAAADAGSDQLPLNVVNNYFSLGADAKVVLEFHESREAHPSKFSSRIGNKFFYAKTGVTDYLTQKHKNLGKSVSIVCDGKDITARIQACKPVCIVFLNIPRYSAGTLPWGHPTGTEFRPQLHDDKLIEVLAFSSNQLGLLYVGGHGERLCQCREAVITTSRAFPVQIDGEPCRLNPSVIKLTFHNQANMIYKSKRGSMPMIPDLPVSEQLKVCINTISTEQYELHNGDKDKLRELSKPSHTAVIPSDADLENVRSFIERIQQQESEKSEPATDQYIFLDLGSTSDRFYRIDRTQESLLFVREVATTDGELFVLNASPKKSLAHVNIGPIETKTEDLVKFTRSQVVNRPITARRRIQSDITGGTIVDLQYAEPSGTILTPHLEERDRSMTAVEKKRLQNSVSTYQIPGKAGSSATVDNNDNLVNKTEADVISEEGIKELSAASSDDEGRKLLSEPPRGSNIKQNSLPANLIKRGSVETSQRSLSTHDITDDVTKDSSKLQHCDIITSESYGSVFSSPPSSRTETPKHKISPSPLCDKEDSQENDDCLVITEPGDVISPLETMTSSPDISSTTESDSTQLPIATMMSSTEVVASSPPSETSFSLKSPKNSLKSDDKSLISQESSPKSPTIEISNHDDLQIHENYSDDPTALTQNLLSRRSTVSAMPSTKKQTNKSRANTTAGMSLTVFVKTQTPPPQQKLISPIKRRPTTRSVSPTKNGSLTLHEFVKDWEELESTVTMTTDQNSNTILTSKDGTNEALQSDESGASNDNQSNNRDFIDIEIIKFNKQYSDASKRGDLSKLKLALESGADPFSQDGEGSTALHNAARFNHPEVVQYLIGNGPSELINQIDRDRIQTPLHKAAWFGHKKVCELLVNAGASLTAVDYKGMTPLQRAQQAEDVKLEAFLSQEAVRRMQDILLKEDKETKL